MGYDIDHIPAFAEVSTPLSNLLKKGKSEQVQWNAAQERAYKLLKDYLLQELVLKLPELMKPFLPRTDPSGVGVTAVLLSGEYRLYPEAEAKYPIIEKECLAVVWVLGASNGIYLVRDSHCRLTI